MLEPYRIKNKRRSSASSKTNIIIYEYDVANELISETYRQGIDQIKQITYEYDGNGNLTKKTTTEGLDTTVVEYTYNMANQLINDGVNTYAYDECGNQISNGIFDFAHNVKNRIIKVSGVGDGSVVAEYAYDANGLRLSKTTSSGTIYSNNLL